METPTQVLLYEFGEIFWNSFLMEYLGMAALALSTVSYCLYKKIISAVFF